MCIINPIRIYVRIKTVLAIKPCWKYQTAKQRQSYVYNILNIKQKININNLCHNAVIFLQYSFMLGCLIIYTVMSTQLIPPGSKHGLCRPLVIKILFQVIYKLKTYIHYKSKLIKVLKIK